MPRRARVECVSLHSSLVNLPVSIYGPLVERNIVRSTRLVSTKFHANVSFQQATAIARGPSLQCERCQCLCRLDRHAILIFTGSFQFRLVVRDNRDRSSVCTESRTFSGRHGQCSSDCAPRFCSWFRQVDIGLLHDMSFAKSVSTEPLTSDDWEIIVSQPNSHPFVS